MHTHAPLQAWPRGDGYSDGCAVPQVQHPVSAHSANFEAADSPLFSTHSYRPTTANVTPPPVHCLRSHLVSLFVGALFD